MEMLKKKKKSIEYNSWKCFLKSIELLMEMLKKMKKVLNITNGM